MTTRDRRHRKCLGPPHAAAGAATGRALARLTGNERGFTLVELLSVAAILTAIVFLALPTMSDIRYKARVSRCLAEIRTLEKDINAFYLDKNVYPAALSDVGQGGLKDPWGHPYRYRPSTSALGTPREDLMGNPLNSDFDLFSVGEDGLSVADISQPASQDDVVRSGDGGFVGLGSQF